MSESAAPIDADPADDVDRQLIQQLHADPTDSNDALQGLELLHRIRAQNPACLCDLQPELTSLAPSPTDGPPSRIGRFEIIRPLGSGGFGVVFLAWDPELEREIALKVPRVETLIHEQSRRRFLREARIAARVQHPHVATVYEAGTVGPLLYIASAYCPGGTLQEFLAAENGSAPLPVRASVSIMIAISHAAHAAHSRGIIHRDIKPSNILLDVHPDQRDRLRQDPMQLADIVRLSDFGLAKLLESTEPVTRTGAFLGTPAYMPPEQVVHRAAELGPAADIYSLGATLYQLLTGRPPLWKANDLATLVAVQQEEPTMPSRVNARVTADLDAICLKCLEKDPCLRYHSANELADDLQRYLTGESVRARRRSRWERFRRWCQRNTIVAVLLVVTLLVSASAATSVVLSWRYVALEKRHSEDLIAHVRNLNRRRVLEENHHVLGALLNAAGPADPQRTPIPLAVLDPTGNRLAFANRNELRLFDLESGEQLSATRAAGNIHCLLFDDSCLLFCDDDGSHQLTNHSVVTYERPVSSVTMGVAEASGPPAHPGPSLCYLRDSALLRSMAAHDLLDTFTDIDSARLATLLRESDRTVCAFDALHRRLAMADPAVNALTIDDADDATPRRRLRCGSVSRLLFSPGGNWLLAQGNGRLSVWSTATWSQGFARSQPVPEGDVAFSPDDALLAYRSATGKIQIVSVAGGRRVVTLSVGEQSGAVRLLWAADGDSLIACTSSGAVHIWYLWPVLSTDE